MVDKRSLDELYGLTDIYKDCECPACGRPAIEYLDVSNEQVKMDGRLVWPDAIECRHCGFHANVWWNCTDGGYRTARMEVTNEGR
jgi:C4-type Zn-finger protein